MKLISFPLPPSSDATSKVDGHFFDILDQQEQADRCGLHTTSLDKLAFPTFHLIWSGTGTRASVYESINEFSPPPKKREKKRIWQLSLFYFFNETRQGLQELAGLSTQTFGVVVVELTASQACFTQQAISSISWHPQGLQGEIKEARMAAPPRTRDIQRLHTSNTQDIDLGFSVTCQEWHNQCSQ